MSTSKTFTAEDFQNLQTNKELLELIKGKSDLFKKVNKTLLYTEELRLL